MKNIRKKLGARYLRFLTRSVLLRFRPDVIAVAGTSGKTRTKEIAKKILSHEFTVRANPRSYNTEIGLPLAVLYLESGQSSFWKWLKVFAKGTAIAATSMEFPSKLILELGTESPGDMDYLLTMVDPRVLIVTNIMSSHLGHFEDIEQVAQEIEKAVRKLKKTDLLIANADDTWALHMRKHSKARVMTYGVSAASDVRATNVKKIGNLQKVTVNFVEGKRKFNKEFAIVGTTSEHLYGLLAAIALGIHYKIGLTEAAKVLGKPA